MLQKKRCCAMFICLALAACATRKPPSPDKVAPYREEIELSGRLSVNYEKDGRQEALSGRFTWQQTAARTDVSLASPLGQTIATISVTPGAAILTRGGQAPQMAADIDALSVQTLGWSLPVSGLRDWLQGYALGADGQRFIASQQQASVTTRDGWQLDYVSWQDDDVSLAPRPKRIDAYRSGSLQSGAVALRIVIDASAPP